MKIGILTYYQVHNHGALLQANALKSVLQKMGHEVVFLTFDRNYDYLAKEKSRKYNISLASVGFYAKYLQEKGWRNILFNLRKRKVLQQYRKDKLTFGGKYFDFDGDITVIGSDEVFSTEIGFNPCFYGYGLQTQRVVSYAASFGPTTLEELRDKAVEDLVAAGLKNMDTVSVRDRNSQKIVEALSGTVVPLVCDPVILYGYYQEQQSFDPIEEEYIVVYSYDKNMNDPAEITAIREFAKNKGCEVVSVGFYHEWCDKNIPATPNELLRWIKYAKFVVTDTFHGAVLSVVCHTPMAVKVEGNQNKLRFLMEEYELQDRVLQNYAQLSEIERLEIDFNYVNKSVEKKRKASLQYLETVLEG